MREAYLLGAGFSKAVNGNMPLLPELSTRVRERIGVLPPPLPSLGENIELWLSYLSQPQPWLIEQHNLENRALFLRIAQSIKDVIDEATWKAIGESCPQWLTTLGSRWHSNQASVVTLNYDTLVERAAATIPNGIDQNGLGLEHIYPVPMAGLIGRSVLGDGAGLRSFKLFKLHGSTNWYYSGAASSYGETLHYGEITRHWGKPDEREGKARVAAAGKAPLIIPPTTEKSTYFRHEVLRHIWMMAAEALRSATQVYFVGYSLPESDLGVRFFLQYANPGSGIPLYVVNDDPAVVERYKRLLSGYQVKADYVGSGSIRRLVNALTSPRSAGDVSV